jgi:hypothetical protein
MADTSKNEITDELLRSLCDIWNDKTKEHKAYNIFRIRFALQQRFPPDRKILDEILMLGQHQGQMQGEMQIFEVIIGRLRVVAPGLVLVDMNEGYYPRFCSGLLVKDSRNLHIPYRVRSFGYKQPRGDDHISSGDVHIFLKSRENFPNPDSCAACLSWSMPGGMDGDGGNIGIANHRWPFMRAWIEKWI